MIRTICLFAGFAIIMALVAIALLFIEEPHDGDDLSGWAE